MLCTTNFLRRYTTELTLCTCFVHIASVNVISSNHVHDDSKYREDPAIYDNKGGAKVGPHKCLWSIVLEVHRQYHQGRQVFENFSK